MNPDEYRIMFEKEDQHGWYVGLRRMLSFVLEKTFHSPISKLDTEIPCPLILDVGCGTGAVLNFLQKYGKSVGIDFSPIAVSYCRKRQQTATAVASAMSLPFGDDTFDLAVSLDVLCHKGVTNKQLPLQEMARVLKPGGLVIMNLPAFQILYSSHDRQVHTDRRFTRKEVIRMLRHAGMEPIYHTYWNTVLLPLILCSRVIRKILPARKSDVASSSGSIARLILLSAFGFERRVLRLTALPVGLSIMIAAKKIQSVPASNE